MCIVIKIFLKNDVVSLFINNMCCRIDVFLHLWFLSQYNIYVGKWYILYKLFFISLPVFKKIQHWGFFQFVMVVPVISYAAATDEV